MRTYYIGYDEGDGEWFYTDSETGAGGSIPLEEAGTPEEAEQWVSENILEPGDKVEFV